MEKEPLEHIRTTKVQVSTVSLEHIPYAHVTGRLRGNFSQRTRHVGLLKDRACAL